MWTILDKGTAVNDLQTVLFHEYLDVLMAGIDGLDCVLSGLAVTGNANLIPSVAKGSVLSNGTLFAVAAATTTIGTADATNPRLDLIVITSAGAIAVRAGTAAANPKPPARTANDVVIAIAYVPATATSLATGNFSDMRVMRSRGPICIYKQTAVRAVNTSAGQISFFASPPSIPSGLFLSGRLLRVRIGGNILLNSGTPTVRLEVLYGGTTMFSFISAAGVADADRRAYFLEFDIVAQANNDQSMHGHWLLNDLVAVKVTPTAGIGDWQTNTTTAEGPPAFGGSAAVDSDAGNRVIDAFVTFSVSNAANELVVEYATVELI